MKIYGIPTCPYVDRVRIALKLRNIQIPIETIDLALPPPNLLAINPSGSVPTLEFEPHDGFGESMVIIRYLDSLESKEPKLYGANAKEVAATEILIESMVQKILTPILNIVYLQGYKSHVEIACAKLEKSYSLFEKLISQTGQFLGGNRLGAADVCLAPFVARLYAMAKLTPQVTLPRIGSVTEKYFSSLLAHSSVRDSIVSQDVLKASLEMRGFGRPPEAVKKILESSRTVMINPEKKIQELNEACPKSLDKVIWDNEPWQLVKNSKGPLLLAEWDCKNDESAITLLKLISDIQETADHHTSTTIVDFKKLRIEICTHEPVWGVSEKDFALALAITQGSSK